MMNSKPAKSKIAVQQNGREFVADIPASKGVGCLMLFGCLFGGIPLIILTAIIVGSVFGTAEVSSSSWWGLLVGLIFISVFVMIGAALVYWGYKIRYTSYQISIREGAVKLTTKIASKETIQHLARGKVHGVGLYSFSETNGKADYNLIIKAREGNDIKLSSAHKEDELRWLASQMLASLSQQGGLPTSEEIEQQYFSSEDGQDNKVSHFANQGVTISLLNDGEFVIEKNGSTLSKSLLIGGLFGMLFGSIFIWVGFGSEQKELLPGIIGCGVSAGAFALFVIGLLKLGTSEKFIFKSDTLTREKLRGTVSKSKHLYQKSEFRKLAVVSSGSSNSETRYSVKLEGNNSKLKLFSWVAQEISEVVKHRVNAWLKPTDTAPQQSASSPNNSRYGYSYGYGGSMTTETSQDATAQATISPSIPDTDLSPDQVPIYSSNTSLTDMKGGIWFLRIFLGLFIIIGLGLSTFGISALITAKQSEAWPSVEGVILNSELFVNDSGEGTTYGARVSYDYSVGNQRYTGDQVTISEVSTSNRSRAEDIIRRYPANQTSTVFHDPTDPQISVLEPGISGGSWLIPGVGLAFCIIPLIILLTLEKAHKKKRTELPVNPNSLDHYQNRYGKVK